jgi:hypothetical protein
MIPSYCADSEWVAVLICGVTVWSQERYRSVGFVSLVYGYHISM